MSNKGTYSPITVANSFIERAKDGPEASDLSQLKLQKLTYLFHGWCFPLDGGAAINYHVEAWRYGPVFPPLYYEARVFGASSISKYIPVTMASWLYDDDEVSLKIPDHDQGRLRILDFVWKRYGHLSAATLVQITHSAGGPWDQTYNATENRGKKGLVIDNEIIQTHYQGLYTDLSEQAALNRARR